MKFHNTSYISTMSDGLDGYFSCSAPIHSFKTCLFKTKSKKRQALILVSIDSNVIWLRIVVMVLKGV